ncbi:MAG TPA: hypothetical protein VLS93_05955 [Anaeromyxobacteraceae bacterium]|nr:hypothetical protein [Anaeromyxobacteraceae bacterium]
MTRHSPGDLRRARPAAALALAAALAATTAASGAAPDSADGGTAVVVLAARSIGSRRGDPPEARAHAALLVRFGDRREGFIVQAGKVPAPGLFAGSRVVGWVIPAADPPGEFARAVGGYWGEPGVRELPTREVARFAVKGLTEAGLRALVDSLNAELRDRDYRLEGGPSSNSFVSRLLDRLGIGLPPPGDVELPGWGWRP